MKYSDRVRQGEKFKVALAKKLGLDPDKTKTIHADWTTGHDMVEIHWEGMSLMSVERFEELMTEVRREQ